MHRCFVSPDDWSDTGLTLAADESHHLLNVLRARSGDVVGVFDGRGREAAARIETVAGGRVLLRVVTDLAPVPPPVRIVLVQAVPKKRNMDLIVEKAVELGASSIWPVMTERVVVKLDTDKNLERAARWQRIALAAARQCGTGWVPDVLPVAGLADVLRRCSSLDTILLGSLSSAALPIRSALDGIRRQPAAGAGIALLVGPEGDFTPDEIRLAEEAGAIQVGMGSRVLRTETAALYGLSVLSYELL